MNHPSIAFFVANLESFVDREFLFSFDTLVVEFASILDSKSCSRLQGADWLTKQRRLIG